MNIVSNRRDGIRVMVSHHIESIIYAENGFPNFCSDFIINMGGIKISNDSGSVMMPIDASVKVCLFNHDGSTLTLDRNVISCIEEYTVIKFDPLPQKERVSLVNMLSLQQACLPGEDI